MFSDASIPQFYANINHHRIETQDFPQTNEHSAVDAEVENESVGQEDSFQNQTGGGVSSRHEFGLDHQSSNF